MSTPVRRGAIFASFAANIGVAIAKLLAYFVTGATSLLAESVHSVVDSSNQILLLIGSHQSLRQPTLTHPFGYGRVHYLYAFLISIALFSLGGIFAMVQGWGKITNPHPIDSPLVAYAILAVSALFEGLALRTALHEARHFKPHRQNWFTFLQQTKSINYVVLALEDMAALTGLTIATLGVSASLLTGNPVWDGVSTWLIGLLLVLVAIFLGREVASLLIGEAADTATESQIRKIVLGVEDVERIINLKTVYIGPSDLFVAMKVGVDGDDNSRRIALAIDRIKSQLRQAFPIVHRIYIEPDIED
jgi:cation diffusion facilitator family transporter